MDAGLMVDGHALVGAAERGCKAALNQWSLSLLHYLPWLQQPWVLSAMALRAIGARERPEALQVLRWVFNAVTPGARGAAAGAVRLSPVLLTALAFKCAQYGHIRTFHWLYTEGRRLAGQGMFPRISAADLNAFKEEVVVPFRAARTDELFFIQELATGTTATICTLMDSAIWSGQQEFVAALSKFDVAPELASFTPYSAYIAAAFASPSLLQWLHSQPACPFPVLAATLGTVCRGNALPPGAGDDAIAHSATEQLIWLRSVGAFQTLTQHHLQDVIGCAAARYAQDSVSALPAQQARIQWLQNEVGADWPRGGAVYIVQKDTTVDARGVVRMVSDLACPWGPWTSAECALVRSRSQQRSSVPPQSVQHWMHQLHALGCPCTCPRLGAEEDV
eukprot:TRINITY_DN2784_c0_g1_i2.p1 TRINITY_DN2784_c0_g1~~TRINITY_DN2784_c0_g1_i2.p1  ORF type:complete len:399 (+),score=79.98 TRINITY_DN2784_c0_g1_i2:24-1199(+)